jgi:DNA mismatch repair protein MutS
VTKPNLSKVPSDYVRQQTLTNRERFVTQELLDLQREITNAQNEISGVESQVFDRVKKQVEEHLVSLRKTAYSLSYLDALYSFAHCAYENNYCSPTFNNNRDVVIKGGRHPVVEQKLEGQFVPNNSSLTDDESLLIITGPNMGGKSTYLRQVAHMCLLAQCGSLVPATEASLPIIDRIFTRIGAGDNVAEGKSTFLVEMEETATICSQATKKSLVILDEVGRGTSTFDGLAIAQAVIEYIYSVIGCRCLFATHYHELTKLPEQHPGITNYHMACKKTNDGIVFIHRIEKGTSQGSFGIDVARLAQLPPKIITRARTLLRELEIASRYNHETSFDPAMVDSSHLQDTVRDLETVLAHKEKLFEELRSINLDELSPRGAFDLLWNLKSKL